MLQFTTSLQKEVLKQDLESISTTDAEMTNLYIY